MDRHILGIDVGGTNVKLGIVAPGGKIVARANIGTKNHSRSKLQLIKAMVQTAGELIASEGLAKQDFCGVGIGLPGLIDPVGGIVRYLPNIPGWRNVRLQEIMANDLGLPVFIENDVNMITLAEWKFGAGVGYENFICITLGTGVGGGLILNNAMYRGEGFVAGEVGHMPLGESTLEGHVGNGVLAERAGKIFKIRNMQPPDVFRLAQEGNARAIEFWEEVGTYLGTTLAGVINLLNLRLVIVGGGVSNNYRFFAPAMKATLKAKAMRVQAGMVKVTRCKLHNDAGIIGARILVEEFLIGKG
ncbi:MAG: ROK family protein [Candidatus Omnitrophica bacterium]|nr:ROK family protein [Candidatus Omnitrophota bacterium]MCB9720585.1 ROK family protein [Candidatus Omnitrophota bacterium]